MKPVELEILLKDNFSPGLESAGRAADIFTKENLAELRSAIGIQKQVVAELAAQVRQLEKDWKDAAPGQEWFDARNRLGSAKAELEQESRSLAELIERQRELGESGQSGHGKAAEGAEKHGAVIVRLLGGQEKYNEVMSKMPPGIRASAQALTGMTGAARAFIATPLGSVLAAIVLALQAVSAWFTSSAEGEMEFARVSGYLGGILAQLKEVAIAVGKAVFNAFTDPKKAVADLWDTIRTNIVNRLEGTAGALYNFGKGLKAAVSLDFDAAGVHFANMGKDLLKTATGIDDVVGKAREWLGATHDLAKANAELNVRERQLHRQRRDWSIEEQEMENRISELRLKAQRGDAAANSEAQRLIRQKYDRAIEYQREELDIIRARNSLTTNSEADYDKEAEAQRRLLALQAERNQQLSFYNRKDTALDNVASRQKEAMEKLGTELAELQRENDEAEIAMMAEGTEKKLRQIENEYARRRNAIEKLGASWRKANRTAGKGGDLDAGQEDALAAATARAEEARIKAVAGVYRAEADAMRDNLKEYGTYQQQKLAVASEYARKIKEAGSDAERMRYAKERDSAMAGISASEIKSGIDWGVVFGELGGMFRSVVEPVLSRTKDYVATDEFRNADASVQSRVLEEVERMEKAVGGSEASFGALGRQVQELTVVQESLTAAQEIYAQSYHELERAQEAYAEAQATGSAAGREAAESALAMAEANEAAAGRTVEALQTSADGLRKTVGTSAGVLKDSMDETVEGLRQLTGGSLRGVYDGLIKAGKGLDKYEGAFGDAMGSVAKKLESVPVVGWIASIIDIFKDGASVVVSGIVDAVFGAVSGILDDVLSGDLAVSLGESVLKGVTGIFDAISFGGFSSLFGNGESDSTLEQDIKLLTDTNQNLQKAIERLTQKLDDSAVAEAMDVYERQKALLEESMANTQELMRRSAAAYNNGVFGIGGSHSANHSVDKGMTGADWDRVSKVTGRDVRSAADFFGLSSEDMAKVLDNATDLYSKIKALAEEGYKDAGAYMDEYVEYYRQLDELQEAFREKVTGTTFANVRDDFGSKLKDMKSDATRFGDDLDEMLFGSLVDSLMSGKYDGMLRDWYDSFADAMADDGTLDEAELARLRGRYREIVENAISERDAIAGAMGYDPDKDGGGGQTGKAGSFSAISQDQGTKLEGLFVSVQGHVANVDSVCESVADRMNTAEEHLAKIADNTGKSAGHLAKIEEMIETIKRDGVRTR